jgi:hypothetical protein
MIWLAVACSGGSASEPRVEPETPPSSVAPPPTTTTEAPPPSTTVEPAPSVVEIDSGVPPVPLSTTTDVAHVRDRYVADLEIEDVDLPTGHTVHVHHPNATVRSRLSTMIDRSLATFADDAEREGGDGIDECRCRAVLASRTLVSLTCSSGWMVGDRGASWVSYIRSVAFEIAGEEVRPVSVEQALLPGATYRDALDGALEDALADYDPDDDRRNAEWSFADATFARTGLHVTWTDEWGSYEPVEGEIRYATILDRIRQDGPIARMLRLGAFARGAGGAAADAPVPPGEAGPWVIGAGMPQVEAAMRWLAMPARLQPAVSPFVGSDLTRLGVTSGVGIDVAREVATTLHGALADAPADSLAWRFALRRANGSVNVRASGDGSAPWLGTIPRDAVVVVIEDPAQAVDDWWRWVAVAPGLDGQSSARYLDETTCRPDTAAIVAAMPQPAREQGARNAIPIVATAIDAHRTTPAVLLLAHDDAHTYASLRRLSRSTCRVGDELGSWTVDGVVMDALVTRTSRGTDGETLVLLQLDADHAPWIALRRGTATPVWRREGLAHPSAANELHAPAMRGPSGRGFWPAAIVQRGRPITPLRWDGTTLVVDTP